MTATYKSFLVGSLLILSLLPHLASAQSRIGLKFVGGKPGTAGSSLDPSALAGAPEVAQNWNDLSGEQGQATGLVANSGKATTVGVTYSSSETWLSTSDATQGPNYALMQG